MEKILVPIVESYDTSEEYLYKDKFNYLKGIAKQGKFRNMAKALPLARFLHDGQHRKGYTEVNGQMVQLPYVLHVLKVCSTLEEISDSFEESFSREDFDLLYTSALLHDVIEDCNKHFSKGGIELVTEYGFPPEVFDIVRLVSKFSGADEYELNAYFNAIKKNKFALLVKLADRSHNVEDLHNLGIEKLHKYVKETRDYIYPLASYGKQHYPEIANAITILKDKIVSLTEEAETLAETFEATLAQKDEEINQLRAELEALKSQK